MAIPTYLPTDNRNDRGVTPESFLGTHRHSSRSPRKEHDMSPVTIISQSLENISALLDRLDPQFDGECHVSGCVHHHPHHDPRLTAAGVGTV